MATVTITGPAIREAGAKPDNRPWKLRAAAYQDGGSGSVITPGADYQLLRPVAGRLAFPVEAGVDCYLENPDGKRYLVTIPDEDSGLWEVIEAGVAFPPDTSQAQLNAAVEAALPPLVAGELEEQTANAVAADLADRDISFEATTVGGQPAVQPKMGDDDLGDPYLIPSAAWASVVGRPVWEASRAYTAGEVIQSPLGVFMARKTSGTSAGSWASDLTNWVLADTVRGWSFKDFGAVGDGTTDDTTACQAALTAAKTAVGVVCVPRGTYLTTTYLLANGSDVTIYGQGRASIIKTTGNHPIIAAQNASGLTIRDIQLLGDGDDTKTSQRGIEGIGVTDSLIENVYVKDTGYDGILLLRGCSNNRVVNNRVHGCKDDGINIGGENTVISRGNVVVGNTVTNCAHTGVHISDGSSFTTVTGNVISECGDAGIDTYQSGAFIGTGSHVITGNSIRDCTVFGIHIRDSDNNIVSGNRIHGGQRSLRVTNSEGSRFTGNTLTGASVGGFLDDTNCASLTVVDNTFDGSTSNVQINSPSAQFYGNRVRGVTGFSVQLTATAVSSLANGNIITGGSGINIEVLGSRCKVSGNVLAGGSTSVKIGSAAAKCSVHDNNIEGATIGVQTDGADTVIASNVMDGQTGHGIYCNSAVRPQVVGNHIQSAARAINLVSTTDAFIDGNVTVSSGTESIVENSASTGTIVTATNRFDALVFLNGVSPVYKELGADFINYGTEYKNSTFDYQRSVWRTSKATLSAVSGASVTATGLIPDGALLLGVTTRINTNLGTSNGTTGYTVGDGTDADLWGAVTLTTAGAASGSAGFTDAAAAGKLYTAAQNVVVTAVGGNFNGTGEIEVMAHYMICEAT